MAVGVVTGADWGGWGAIYWDCVAPKARCDGCEAAAWGGGGAAATGATAAVGPGTPGAGAGGMGR